MEAMSALLLILAGIVGLDLVAVRFGHDSRDPLRDDHLS